MSETNPTPPVVPPPGVIAYQGPEPDKDAKTMAMLAHLLGIITGPIGALIIWMVKKEQQPFVADQGKEALNFEITIAIGFVALFILSIVGMITFILSCFVWVLMVGLWVTNLIFCIMAGMKANQGIAYRYPFALRLVK